MFIRHTHVLADPHINGSRNPQHRDDRDHKANIQSLNQHRPLG